MGLAKRFRSSRVVPHSGRKGEGIDPGSSGPRIGLKQQEFGESQAMPNRLETYRVEAYNTAKQSENKMHDDNVARRFGFSGGLVPGVDVFAYMMHVPVARWGRDFLSRGLIAPRCAKPVDDGGIAPVGAAGQSGRLTIEVFSRPALDPPGTPSLPVT